MALQHPNDRLACLFVTVVEIHRPNHGFHSIAHDRISDVLSTHFCLNQSGQTHPLSKQVEGFSIDHLGLLLGQPSFLFFRKLLEQHRSNGQIQRNISQKLQPFIAALARRIAIKHGRVRQSFLVKLLVFDPEPELSPHQIADVRRCCWRQISNNEVSQLIKQTHSASCTLNNTEALCPPNPNVFDSAARTGRC